MKNWSKALDRKLVAMVIDLGLSVDDHCHFMEKNDRLVTTEPWLMTGYGSGKSSHSLYFCTGYGYLSFIVTRCY